MKWPSGTCSFLICMAVLGLILAFSGTATADDCSPTNVEDCLDTGYVGGILSGIISILIGLGAARIGQRAADRAGREPEYPEPVYGERVPEDFSQVMDEPQGGFEQEEWSSLPDAEDSMPPDEEESPPAEQNTEEEESPNRIISVSVSVTKKKNTDGRA